MNQEDRHCIRWTKAEDEQLLTLHGEGISYAEMARRTGRTVAALKYRLRRRGLVKKSTNRSWTTKETEAFKQMHANGCPFQEIADALGRTKSAVTVRGTILGLRPRKHKLWTTGDVQLLARLIKNKTPYRRIAEIMHRSRASVETAATAFGLRRSERERIYWTAEDDARFAQMWADGHSISEIAKALGRTYGAINSRRYEKGMPVREAQKVRDCE